jgi:hypothetical protein
VGAAALKGPEPKDGDVSLLYRPSRPAGALARLRRPAAGEAPGGGRPGVLTIAVVVSTANHYWLDGIVVLVLLAVSVLLLRPPAPDRPVRAPG